MCTRPDRRSVSASFGALREAVVATVLAFSVLLAALVAGPFRSLQRRRARHVPASRAASIDVQVHLEDRKCVAELKRGIRRTLRRAARTWAPMPLPIDRVVVGVGFPIPGKVDLYDQFPEHEERDRAASRALVVVSLGLRDGDREVEPAEIAGALAAQIQAVIDERYRQRGTAHTLAGPASGPTDFADVPRPTAPAQASRSIIRSAPVAAPPPPAITSPASRTNGVGSVDTSVPRLQELVAAMQKGQPLDAAGPSPNGTHP